MTAFAVVAANGNCRYEAEPHCRQFLTACINQLPKEQTMSTETPATEVKKVDASKENAAKALQIVARPDPESPHPHTRISPTLEEYAFLMAFMKAAERRLPSQAAIDKDKKRKQKYHENKKKKPVAA